VSRVLGGMAQEREQPQSRVRVSRLSGEGAGALPKGQGVAGARRPVGALSGIWLCHCSGNGWCMGELVEQLEERLGRLDPASSVVAKDFIGGWKALAGNWQHTGLPLGHIWHAHIANHPEGAALLGWTEDLREHRPHTEIACLAPCVICDREEPGEEELQAQGAADQSGHPTAVRSEPPEGSGVRTGAGGRSPEDGNGEAGDQGQRRTRDNGEAEATDSWCTNWVKKAEARRREEEKGKARAKELEHRGRATAKAAETVRREQEVRDERLKKEEEQWLLEQLERFIPEVGEKRKERAREIREDVGSNPRLRAGLVEISRFFVVWDSLQRDCKELDVPAERVWPAHIANHPEAALSSTVSSVWSPSIISHGGLRVSGALQDLRSTQAGG
jgi:hypothetical protein